jgi:imidazolonepropionase-like amidohydrolase
MNLLAAAPRWAAPLQRLAAVALLAFALLPGRAHAGDAAAAAGAPGTPTPPTGARPLVLTHATVFPSPEAAAIFDGEIVIADGKIVAVGKMGSTPAPAGATTLDCGGQFVVAGFQNSHVHFTEPDAWIGAAGRPAAQLTARLQAMLTRWGFTTVVDTASYLPNTTALRQRIASGELPGPRILTAGLALYPPNGIPYYLKDMPEEMLKLLPQPATSQAATELVHGNLAAGADITKLFTGSWVGHGHVMPMPVEVATAAAAETHGAGKLVFSHPSNLTGLEVALAAHVDVLAHAVEDTRGLTPWYFARMRQQNMAMIPTLKLFGEDRDLYEILDEVRDFHRAGGQILFGTDVGFLTDYDPTVEYVLLESAGLDWRDVLATLTTEPAARFGELPRRGTIAAGKDADLVVLAGSPVTDPRAFAKVRYTIRAGKVIYTAP